MFVRCKAERLRVQDAKAEVRSRSGTGCAWTKRVTLQPELSEQVQIAGCSTLRAYLLATSLVLSRAHVQSVWTAIALSTMTVVNHVGVLIGHRMSADTQYIEAKNDTSCIRSRMFWHIYANPEACLICALTQLHFYAATVLFE